MIPKSGCIFVYNDSISRLASKVIGVTLIPWSQVTVPFVSPRYDGSVVTNGISVSERLSLPETMGLPGMGLLFLWVFGRE